MKERKFSSKRFFKLSKIFVTTITVLAIISTILSWKIYSNFSGKVENIPAYQTCLISTKEFYSVMPMNQETMLNEFIAKTNCLNTYVRDPLNLWSKVGVLSVAIAVLLPLTFFIITRTLGYLYPVKEIKI